MSKFKKSLGAPVCGRYGHLLGRPGAKPGQLEKLGRQFAGNCDAHGQPLPPIPVQQRFEVVLPDPAVRLLAKNDATVSSCAMCQNFVSDENVANELGWLAGLCAAKGKLILPNRRVMDARDCEYRDFGTPRNTTTGLHLLPVYEDAFNLNVDPTRAYFARGGAIIEPSEYPTDKPVTTEDEAGGIRAWRKIADPEGTGNEVYLPIYNVDRLPDAEKVKVPKTGDDEHPEMYVDHNGAVYKVAVLWTELDETPALWGMAGVGKTELYRHLAWMMQLPFERISVTASTELDDLAGKMHFSKEKGTYFEYGRIPLAWSKPSVICLDEPNTGQPDVWQFIRPLTDNSKQLVLDMNKGERISRHTDCYMGMAMNPAWDPKNVGTATIGDADGSRLMHIQMDLPPEELEREILKNRVKLDGWEIDKDRLDSIMSIAHELRALCDDGTLPITWGIRPQIKVARATRWFDMVTAYRMASADYLEPEAQDALLDIVRAHVSQ